MVIIPNTMSEMQYSCLYVWPLNARNINLIIVKGYIAVWGIKHPTSIWYKKKQ